MSHSKSYATVGKPKLRLAPVTSAKLPFVAEMVCVQCARALTVKYGVVSAVFMIGNEFVGICCDECLTPESQRLLREHRQLQEKP